MAGESLGFPCVATMLHWVFPKCERSGYYAFTVVKINNFLMEEVMWEISWPRLKPIGAKLTVLLGLSSQEEHLLFCQFFLQYTLWKKQGRTVG
jgi:hypothetical protein